AAGTPVIAWNHGSVPELIEDGVTGFIVESEAQAAYAARRIHEIDRGVVRRAFERRFSAVAMARKYFEHYGDLIRDGGHWQRSARPAKRQPIGALELEPGSGAHVSMPGNLEQ